MANEKVKFLDLNKQYKTIKTEIDFAIKSVISDSAFVSGKYVLKFENDFSKYIGLKYCIAVGNGTDALEIAIESLNLPQNSEIIVPANTFIACSEAVTRTKHKVKFCDINLEDYTISIEDLKSKITKKTKAIIVVHLFGHPCNMKDILKIAKEHEIKIIEDCSQAHGSRYFGKMVGTFCDIATFSFYPGKNLGAYGDAGAILTNNKKLADKCRLIANHGRINKYEHIMQGRNSRMDGLQAAILTVKLKHLDEWILKRRKIANYYLNNLKNVKEIILPKISDSLQPAYHLFVIRTKKRNDLQKFLESNNIQTGIHYPISLVEQKAYSYLKIDKKSFFASRISKSLLSLPIGEHLSLQDAKFVCGKIKEFFKK